MVEKVIYQQVYYKIQDKKRLEVHQHQEQKLILQMVKVQNLMHRAILQQHKMTQHQVQQGHLIQHLHQEVQKY